MTQKVEFERKWLYLNLAVNGKSGSLRWAWRENMKSDTIASVLEGWEKEGVKVVVWDRAPGHHGKAYEGVRVQRIEQPPYSPELNPAERVFEHLRAQVEGKTYGSLEAKKAAVEAELKKLAAIYLSFPRRAETVLAREQLESLDMNELRRLVRLGAYGEALRMLNDEIVEDLSATGDANSVRDKLEKLKAIGITLPILYPVGNPQSFLNPDFVKKVTDRC